MVERSELAAQVAQYEQALRTRVRGRAVDGDPTLAALHREIGARRRRRPMPGDEPIVRVVSGPTAGGTAVAERPVAGSGSRAGRVLAIESLGRTVKVFRIGRPKGFTFRAGQYLKLGVPGGKREDFSIASAPHETELELAIELREGGTVTPRLFALRVGDAVDIADAPKGSLRLDPEADHHLMVATVTGIAPLRSMVLDALNRGSTASFTILHGASYVTDLVFADQLAELAGGDDRIRYVPTISRPTEPANRSWTGPTGRVDPLARVVAGSLDPRTTHVYAVGNAGMIKAVKGDLGGTGFRISTESYGG
jgi:ferredoxin--NADP+ reductase